VTYLTDKLDLQETLTRFRFISVFRGILKDIFKTEQPASIASCCFVLRIKSRFLLTHKIDILTAQICVYNNVHESIPNWCV